MKIAEIYQSIQGEGLLTGTPSVFVRTSGCNLRCCFCDTPYTSWEAEGKEMSPEGILALISKWDTRHVVLTGGEPMLFGESIPLSEELHAVGKHVTVETAGTLYLPVRCDLMSISPKLSNSTPRMAGAWSRRHERARHRPEVIRRMLSEYEYQIKFVVASPHDLEEIHRYLDLFHEMDHSCVLLMPEGIDPVRLATIAEWLRPHCTANSWRFCPRQQIEWFGMVRGT
jgi:7-carboxy-7-deazaguanine synthase